MKKIIDCLIIGHNEMDFSGYEMKIRKMGTNTGAFRDLDLDFIRYNNKPCTASEVFNLFYSHETANKTQKKLRPLTLGETFSATIAYLGTYLHQRGFSFDYINSFQDNKEELAEKLINYDFRVVAVTTTYYVSVFPIVEIMDFIKKYNQRVKVIAGGPFIYTQYRTQDPASLEYLFNSVIGADFYVINSQGEAALVEILRRLRDHLPFDYFEPFPNVYHRANEVKGAKKWPPISRENNILSENMVKWDLFTDGVGEFANLRTSISCPFSCAFCGFPQHAGKYQVAGIEEVEKELRSLNKRETIKSVHFIDDTFNIPVKRFKEILRMMIKNKFRFKWYSHFRCQFADREMIELMRESGCEGVFLGIESGNDQVLKNMNKSAKVEKYLEGIRLLKEYDILTYGSFIIGFPGETDKTVQDSIRFIKESGLDFFRAQLWYCEPITPIWQDKEKYQLKGNSFEWSHSTMDSNKAADYVDEIFMSIERPVWVPQYNFECDALFHLLHRGLNIDQIKNFLQGFNNGVREKIKKHSQAEVSLNCINQIIKSLGGEPDVGGSPSQEIDIVEKFNADFDFS